MNDPLLLSIILQLVGVVVIIAEFILPSGATSIALKINETWIGQEPGDLARRIDRTFGGQGA